MQAALQASEPPLQSDLADHNVAVELQRRILQKEATEVCICRIAPVLCTHLFFLCVLLSFFCH